MATKVDSPTPVLNSSISQSTAATSDACPADAPQKRSFMPQIMPGPYS
eukprot:CAMPEP_0114176170 /NCGR_PEP_ID=MMETSP0043_2-20121206/37348_1 /TAXON_ID=464988 /ORGANISM="Hemiselmis andersenii, Strain CCMP644" /LENGTH=47 /DNA_ID= /DNA_START= /DNA_END= /DNA_ORIENTATION=